MILRLGFTIALLIPVFGSLLLGPHFAVTIWALYFLLFTNVCWKDRRPTFVGWLIVAALTYGQLAYYGH